MDPSINIKNLNMKTKQLTPYAHYQNTEEWAIIERLLKDLMANRDIELKTAPEYVIGYLVEKLRNKDLKDQLKQEREHLQPQANSPNH